jgi:kynurenine formamidase
MAPSSGSGGEPAPVMEHDDWVMHPAGRTGLEFYDLSHPFGPNAPLWPYFDDVEIKRIHYHAKSGVLSQRISTVMHCTTHLDAPAHVVEGTPYTDELPLEQFFGTGVAVSIPRSSGRSSPRRTWRPPGPRSAPATS